MGEKPLWHGCCIMLSESRSQKGRGKERELGTEEQTKSLDAKSESPEPKIRAVDLSIINSKKQVEVPREAQAEQRMRKIEIRRFLLCC